MTITFDVVLNRFQENKVLQIAQTTEDILVYVFIIQAKKIPPCSTLILLKKKTYRMLVTVYLDTLVTKPLPHIKVILTIIVLLLSPKRLLGRCFLFP